MSATRVTFLFCLAAFLVSYSHAGDEENIFVRGYERNRQSTVPNQGVNLPAGDEGKPDEGSVKEERSQDPGPRQPGLPSETVGEKPEPASDDLDATSKHLEADYQLEIEGGRVIDVRSVFLSEGQEIESGLVERMRLARSPLIRLNHEESRQPMLLASRRGKVLHGPFASFDEQGAPIAYVTYNKGERSSAVLTWDEKQRPLVFAQYDSGKLDGMRVLFRACCQSCQSGHIWMVQQWSDGVLQTAHVVDREGKAKTIAYRNGEPYETTPELHAAVAALESFEKRLRGDELKLKQFVSGYYTQERSIAAQRARLQAAQRNYQFMSAVQGARLPTSTGGLSMAVM